MASSTSTAVASQASALPSSTILAISEASTAVSVPGPLSTQYSFPSDCNYDGMYNFTIGSQVQATVGFVNDNGYGTLVETYGYINKSAAHYTRCYRPPAETEGLLWSAVGLEDLQMRPNDVYRAAVCPQKWVALGVGKTQATIFNDKGKITTTAWSTAHCCRSGDSLYADIWSLDYESGVFRGTGRRETESPITNHPSACAQPWHGGIGATFSLTGVVTSHYTSPSFDLSYVDVTSTISLEKGRAFYPAWSVEWLEEDNTSLQPPWPTLTGDMYLPTWTPGAGKVDPERDYDPPQPTMSLKTAKTVIATLAVLAFLFGVGCVFFLWKWLRAKRPATKAGKERIAEERSRVVI